MPDTVTIRLALPAKALSPNARVHWARKATAARDARHAARWTAVEAWQTVAPRHEPPKWERARLDIRAFWKDSRSLRDDDNLVSCMKAARDGLADAGLVANDKCFVQGEVKQDIDGEDPRIELTVTKL